MPVSPDKIKQRFTITLPDPADRFILAAIINQGGLTKSAAIRTALRTWAKTHGILPETLSAAPSTNPPTG